MNTHKLDIATVSRDWATKNGYVPYAGPYAVVSEREMLDNAIADIIRNRRDKECVVSIGGNRVEIYIKPNHYAQNIYKEVEVENEAL